MIVSDSEQVILMMPTKLLTQVDTLIDEQLFVDRHEFIRIAVRSYVERMKQYQSNPPEDQLKVM